MFDKVLNGGVAVQKAATPSLKSESESEKAKEKDQTKR